MAHLLAPTSHSLGSDELYTRHRLPFSVNGTRPPLPPPPPPPPPPLLLLLLLFFDHPLFFPLLLLLTLLLLPLLYELLFLPLLLLLVDDVPPSPPLLEAHTLFAISDTATAARQHVHHQARANRIARCFGFG